MRIFAWFTAEEASNDGGRSKSAVLVASVAMSLEPLEIGSKLSYMLTIRIISMHSSLCPHTNLIVAGVL